MNLKNIAIIYIRLMIWSWCYVYSTCLSNHANILQHNLCKLVYEYIWVSVYQVPLSFSFFNNLSNGLRGLSWRWMWIMWKGRLSSHPKHAFGQLGGCMFCRKKKRQVKNSRCDNTLKLCVMLFLIHFLKKSLWAKPCWRGVMIDN